MLVLQTLLTFLLFTIKIISRFSSSRDSSIKRESYSPPRAGSPARSISPPILSKRARLSGPLDSLAAAASSVLSSSAHAAPPPPQTMGLGFITDDMHSRPSSCSNSGEIIHTAPGQANDLHRLSPVGAPAELGSEMAGASKSGRSKGSKPRSRDSREKETTLGKRRGGDAREKTKNLTVAVGPLDRPGLEYSPIVPPPPRSAPPKSTTPSVLLPVPEKVRAQPPPYMHTSPHPLEQGIGPKQYDPRRRQSASAMSPSAYTTVHQLPAGQASYSALSSYKLPQPTQLPTPVRPDYPRATGSYSGRPASSHSMSHTLSGGVEHPRPTSAGGRDRAIPPHVYHSSTQGHAHTSGMAGYYTSPPQYRFVQPPPSPTSRNEAAHTPRAPTQPSTGNQSPPLSGGVPSMTAASASKQAFIGFLSTWYDTMTAETRHLSRQLEDQVRRSSQLLSALQSAFESFEQQDRQRRTSATVKAGQQMATASDVAEFGRQFDKRMSHVAGDLTKEIEAFATRLDKCEKSILTDVPAVVDEQLAILRTDSITSGSATTASVPPSLIDRLDKLERALGRVSRRISDGSTSPGFRRQSRASVVEAENVADFDRDEPSDDDVRRKLSSDSGSTAGTMVQQPPVMNTAPESSEKMKTTRVASVVETVAASPA
ncbi:hypothetical protein OIV83_002789 [Microbotryomycetes sp. JL201]|nr:hypothetical protein OIV83_002789 [Microbotryomycetes sp. JL201]